MDQSWRFAKEEDLQALTRFLVAHEHGCVAFTAQLRRGAQLVLPPKLKERVALYRDPQGVVRAAILHASTGFVYPVFDESLDIVPEPKSRVLTPLRHPPLMYGAVMGSRRDVDLFEGMVSASVRDDMMYYLMWRPAANADQTAAHAPPAHPDIRRVRTAGMGDFKSLLPLQEAYEREEVLLPGRSLSPRVVEHNLRRALKEQLVLLGETRERVVAKVATNARGLHFDQVGGVFTKPEFRNRGIATHLMQHLIGKVGADGRATTLFVKKHNTPAVTMYRRLGYTMAGDFRILYYR
jgi:predicted GNAT family acetyltransferase